MKITARSEEETIQAAGNLARELRGNEAIMLYGPLGAGKTAFARALVRALCGAPGLEVPSPTFTLSQIYYGENGAVTHYDFYRLKEAREIHELGWEDSLQSGVTIVEWPERLGNLLPAQRIDIRFSILRGQPEAREIEIERVSL